MAHKVSPTQKVLNVWAIVLILWSIYRTKFNLPEWFDEFIAKPLVFLGPVYIFLTRFEGKKDFFKEVGFTRKNLWGDVRIALVIGLLFLLSALGANYIKSGGLALSQEIISKGTTGLLYLFILALATGIIEETLSRGFVLKQLFEDSQHMLSSVFLSSMFFLILHIPILFTNLQLSGNALLFFLATDFILSLVNSFVFLDRKSLTAPILIHALYNMAILLYI